MANESKAEPVPLPRNWRDLKISERFAVVRDSHDLIRGSRLANLEIDCRKRKIKDLEAHFDLKFRYPTLEDGSFAFVDGEDRLVMGKLEVLSSDARRYDRVHVLRPPTTFEKGKTVPYALSAPELAHIASMLEAFHNHCEPAPAGHHIEAYVILAMRER